MRKLLAEIRQKPAYPVDPVAFVTALIGGPLLVTAVSFWLLFIPVYALVLGGPIYLVIGTPLLLIYLRRAPVSLKGVSVLALLPVAALMLLILLWGLISRDDDIIRGGLLFGLFGLFFAPLWAAAFGWVYLKITARRARQTPSDITR